MKKIGWGRDERIIYDGGGQGWWSEQMTKIVEGDWKIVAIDPVLGRLWCRLRRKPSEEFWIGVIDD